MDLVEKGNALKANELIRQKEGQSIRVIDLIQDENIVIDVNSLVKALKELERQGDIYIERHPRLENGIIRKDIRSSDIVYFNCFPSIDRKSLLYQTKVEYGDYTINHILGCAHGCQYPCYAMNISKRWGRISDYEDWMHPRVVGNALDLLERELPRLNGDIQFVHMSFMTDPFMFDAPNNRNFPWIQNLTLELVERINQEAIKVTTLTKGLSPIELTAGRFDKENEYGITLVSLSDEFHAQFEPFSAEPLARIQALERLHQNGLKTWVSLEPYPTPNIIEQELSDILAEVAFVDKIVFGKWNYNALINGHPDAEKFYVEGAGEIIRFAKENGIDYHIKEGTPRNSAETEKLFLS